MINENIFPTNSIFKIKLQLEGCTIPTCYNRWDALAHVELRAVSSAQIASYTEHYQGDEWCIKKHPFSKHLRTAASGKKKSWNDNLSRETVISILGKITLKFFFLISKKLREEMKNLCKKGKYAVLKYEKIVTRDIRTKFFLFRQSKKKLVYILVFISFFHISREESSK